MRPVWSQGEGPFHFMFPAHQLNKQVDPSVVISLRTGWDILQPSKMFGEGCMLPLIDVLKENEHVVKFNLSSASMQDSRYRSAGNGNSNARALNFILRSNSTIQELNLSDNGLDNDGIAEISAGLEQNSSITKLNLSGNYFGELGAERLRIALQKNVTIKNIDLSRNALGFQSISSIISCCAPKGIVIQASGNFVFEEVLNSVSHGIAFLFSVVGAILLITQAAESEKYSDYHFWAVCLYSFSLMFLFLSSCLFHSFFMMPQSKSTHSFLYIFNVSVHTIFAQWLPLLLQHPGYFKFWTMWGSTWSSRDHTPPSCSSNYTITRQRAFLCALNGLQQCAALCSRVWCRAPPPT